MPKIAKQVVRRLLFCGFFLGWQASLAMAATTVLRIGRLVDGKGQIIDNAVVVIENNLIASVGESTASIPAGAKVIDLSGYSVIPGLIDVHTHMTFFWDGTPGTTPYHQPKLLPAEVVVLAQANAQKTLECGVTTVRDLNAAAFEDIAMRNLIRRGAMVGPRMFVSSYGLGTEPGFVSSTGYPINGVPEMRKAVREVIASGADWIKLFASTGGTQDLTGSQVFTYDEIQAAAEVAHLNGKRVAVHTYGPAAAADAVKAGVDTIEHAIDIDDQTLATMARQGTYYVPTIYHNEYYAENADKLGFPPDEVERLNAFVKKNIETTRRALKAGVKVAMGSDAVYTLFGHNTHELAALVQAGMTPAQALEAATTTGAALLNMENSLGKIAPGYYADIVAVKGDPLSDVNVIINHVEWVMKDGTVVVDRTGPAAH
jgi:imidazolonepropionase-like amidohydrolase